jgi:ArsR family transcriptional regulator
MIVKIVLSAQESTVFLEYSKYHLPRPAESGLTYGLYFHKSGYMESEQAVMALAALSQSTRLEAFRTLVRHEPNGLAAGDLARLLEVPQNTLSAHLSVLSRAGLVTSERHSRSIIYRASLANFQKVAVFLLQDCCGGRPEICAPIIESLQPCCPPKRKERSRA